MEKPEIYMHSFDCKKSICREFEIDESTLDDCHVYLAYYHVGDYGCDSSAFVLFEDSKGKLFEVNGAHCSCHGLSEQGWHHDEQITQWQPEETHVEALKHRLEKGSLGDVGGYDDKGYADESRIVINYLKSNS